MCIKNVKRALAATLMATLVMASTLTAAAAGTGGTGASAGSSSVSGNSSSSSGSSASSSSASSSESSSSEESTVEAAAEQVEIVKAGGTVKVAGTSVTNTIAGAIIAKTVQGVAVTTPLADVKASLGLTGDQTPYIIVFDTDAKKSNLAMACVNSAISANGGTYVTALNVNLGAKSNGKFVTLSNGSAAMAVGLPKNADTSKTYYVVCVQPGGVISILQDQDTNPATVTFEIKAGLGTYALVAK